MNKFLTTPVKTLAKKEIGEFFTSRINRQVLIIVAMITIIFPVLMVNSMNMNPEFMTDIVSNLDVSPTDIIENVTGGEQGPDFSDIMLGAGMEDNENPSFSSATVMINSAMPSMFLMITTLVTASVAATSFVGEKEKKTLETLFYTPIHLKDIFKSKVFVSFSIGMIVTYAAFATMFLLMQFFSIGFGWGVMPFVSLWLPLLLWVVPGLSLFSIVIIVNVSARASTSQEAMQRSTYLLLPIMVFIGFQFMGIITLTVTYLFFLGLVLVLFGLAWWRKAIRNFTYEAILK